MLVVTFPAAAFGTNCYIMSTGPGQECIVVDPGIGVESLVAEVIAEHRLKPTAVLLTHGHLDHVYSVTPVCGGTTAAYIHADDRYRLDDPLASIGPAMLAMMEQQFGARATWRAPERVIDLGDHDQLTMAGLAVDVLHAPGHTEGSVMFALDGVPEGLAVNEDLTRTLLSGDVLFAGSIGRTDLPGGDGAAMTASLRDVVLTQPDSTVVLTGHGPATTIRRERATNPYLQGL